ncbi:MAG: tRNA dihydrouridine synthase [Phycisphaerales bacterium]
MLRFGRVQLATNLLLAPIAGYCDLAWRLICRSHVAPDGKGLGLACTDLLSPQGLLRGTATSLDLARTSEEDQPICMQLYGCDPAIMSEGARWAAEHGATVVDINMGCPVDKVTKKDGGSRLLCIPDTAEDIVRACARVLEPMGIPLTCKMRLGWFDDDPVAERLAPRLIDAGAAGITVHGRTTQQKFEGVVNLDGIARVVEAVRATGSSVPVIGNGDVRTPEDALAMVRRTGCDGVMIGRGALSTPWIFRDAWWLATTGERLPEPAEEQKLEMIERYLDLMLRFRDEHYAMYQIRRRISWLGKKLNGGHCKPLKEAVRNSRTVEEVRECLRRYGAGGLRGGDYAGAGGRAGNPRASADSVTVE